MQHLFSQQEAYRRSADRQLRGYKRAAQLLLWSSPEKEISQGFSGVDLSLLSPEPGELGLANVGGEDEGL